MVLSRGKVPTRSVVYWMRGSFPASDPDTDWTKNKNTKTRAAMRGFSYAGNPEEEIRQDIMKCVSY